MRKFTDSQKSSGQKKVEIKLLSQEFCIYSNPTILLSKFKGGKRAEAAQWSLEVQKMHRGIVESVRALGNFMNQTAQNKKLYLENQEITIPDEKRRWTMIYLIDNSILRNYAWLDKIAQLCRCYFEYSENGGELEVIQKCGCKEIMTEKNCNFGALLNYLARDNKKNKTIIVEALKKLNSDKSIQTLREYRNAFTHKKNFLDQTVGLDPTVKATYKDDGTVSTVFNFGEYLPSINWFRVAIVNANNALVECTEQVGSIIFPRDFKQIL